jgi:hypothetical protein
MNEKEGTTTSGAWKNFDTSLSNLHNKIWRDDWVNAKSDYSVTGDGTTDDITNLDAAVAALSSGGTLVLPVGTYRIASNWNINKRIRVIGATATSSTGAANRASTVILKDGNFVGVTISSDDVVFEGIQIDGASGNGNDGLQITGGRVTLRDVSVTSQGGNGIRIGDTAGSNVNHFYLERILTISNGDNGVYIHDGSGGGPNANAGIIVGLDTRGNTNDGIEIDNAVDNQIFGLLTQVNDNGIHLASNAKGNAFFHPYTESNTTEDGIMDASSQDNYVWGYRQGVNQDAWSDSGTNNTILGRYSTRESINQMAFEKAIIEDRTISGRWEFTKNTTTRDLEVTIQGTDANARLVLKHAGAGAVGLASEDWLAAGYNTGPRIYAGSGTPEGSQTAYIGSIYQRFDGGVGTAFYIKESGTGNTGWNPIGGLSGSASWNPGSIADGDEEAQEVTATGAALGDFAIASFSLDVADLVLNAQVTASNTVTCILANNTGGAIDLGAGTVYVKVLKK